MDKQVILFANNYFHSQRNYSFQILQNALLLAASQLLISLEIIVQVIFRGCDVKALKSQQRCLLCNYYLGKNKSPGCFVKF